MYIITGASRGLGKIIFDYYEVYSCMGIYNSTSVLNSNNNLFKLNISDFFSVESFFKKHEDKLTQVNLINLAGISYNAFAHKSDINSWKEVIDINLTGTFNIIKCVLNKMRYENYGRIINFSSVVAQKGFQGTTAYAASKAALWGMTKSLVKENAIHNITINNINLGYTNIGMIEQVPEEKQKALLDEIPSKMFCPIDDIISTVDYIIKTPYLNGVNIDLNGGLF